MSRFGTVVLSGESPTKITIERDGVVQTVIFERFDLEINRGYEQVDASTLNDAVRQYFYLVGDEEWHLQGRGKRLEDQMVAEPVLDRYVIAHHALKCLLAALGREMTFDEAVLNEAISQVEALRDTDARVADAIAVIMGQKVALAPEQVTGWAYEPADDDEDDESPEDVEDAPSRLN